MEQNRDGSMWRIVARARRLPRAERRMAVEALAALAAVRVALALLPFARVMTLLGLQARASEAATPANATPEGQTLADAIGRAIRRSSRIAPFRAVCLQEALAAAMMLRRRGCPTEVHFGVSRDDAGLITAHAWSVFRGVVVTGEEARAEQTPIAIFAP